jgi:prepilin signal peptidase PulO-like enzyme (type II secretory pathway)
VVPLLFFIFGAIVASFMGVVAVRLNTGESIVRGRSRCDACGEVLAPLTLVPLLSYVASRARAVCCGARLRAGSPLAELLLGILFMLAYLKVGLTYALVFYLASLALLLALVLYDLAHQILPFSLLIPFVATSGVASYLTYGADVLTLFGAIGIALLLALIHLFSRGRAMGLADAPLALGLALLAGPTALSGFIYSFWVGAVVGIIILLKRAPGTRMGVEVPFAPFLAAGFLIASFTQWNLFDIRAASLFLSW